MSYITYLVPILGLIGLLVMFFKRGWVVRQDSGDPNMKEIADAIADGALAFLKAEWRVLIIFGIIVSILLGWSGTLVENSSVFIGVSFIAGAFISAYAGYIGMNIATKSNVRTTQAARTSLSKALEVSFTGGSVMGIGVASLAVIGLGGLFIILYYSFVKEGADVNGAAMEKVLEVLAGFSLGAESIALFARVGGGIYTKAADVGADLVGKVEAGIPEDDPRNPATIADNVGDNVGDVAGMGADLFGSYVATILATMVLGREIISSGDNFGGIAPILLPMVIAGVGLVASIIGMLLVKVTSDQGDVQGALNRGNWGSIIITLVVSYPLTMWMLPSGSLVIRGVEFGAMDVFYAILLGSVVGAIMAYVTEYYTAMGKRPVQSIVNQSSTGHATNIIGGLSVGMESTVIPTLVLAAGIFISYEFAGLYGVAIAAAGMMATTAMQLAIDAFGPIADNAGGIAEMAHLPEEVRGRTDILDAVGNTTAASGKGFAIASAALTSLALFAAFCGVAGISAIDIYKANVLAGLFVGAMIPFIFSSLAIAAVGRAAMKMVEEVRRQFREIPGIMEGTAKPEYDKCVAISTQASIKEMIAPGLIALIVPVLVGFLFGPEVLGGTLAGVTVSGVLMGIFQNNAGGAWDNAKKSFEKGAVINGQTYYKKSDPHKAAVTGDTVGDPFKDTSGPSMNILIKLMSIVSLVIAPHIAVTSHEAVEVVEVMETPVVVSETAILELNGMKLNIAASGTPVESALLEFIQSDAKADKETWFDFDRLLFETGSDKLKPVSQEQLENVAEILKAYPNVKVKLGGYTDNTGDSVANLKLSTARAESVEGSLRDLGIEASRLESEGYGEEHPVASNETEEGRAQNRRISIRVTSK
ncbi:Putative K(+)-stimulated pyrophosphate-energized sodium pump [Dyadobacter sp. CECT 9275]|uniref:Putative K(+)-stimulated pyrophosphate-energized sodium pump n=1 Tax=Dyadobacter helix TaxID=2822344 RepID=A0A916N3I2_9BACT|nr:sodium-translocating pyrophosphatase [Dyadobacter sp. CECT 9275]CAG4995072.1 Putative K(+)-stimulated pyrophosphate-energized sodium pump [Dyadobacter sp. CECT 9275]